MREIRLSGSEGGAAQQCAVPTPHIGKRQAHALRAWLAGGLRSR